jgi:hypothetical protein
MGTGVRSPPDSVHFEGRQRSWRLLFRSPLLMGVGTYILRALGGGWKSE